MLYQMGDMLSVNNLHNHLQVYVWHSNHPRQNFQIRSYAFHNPGLFSITIYLFHEIAIFQPAHTTNVHGNISAEDSVARVCAHTASLYTITIISGDFCESYYNTCVLQLSNSDIFAQNWQLISMTEITKRVSNGAQLMIIDLAFAMTIAVVEPTRWQFGGQCKF